MAGGRGDRPGAAHLLSVGVWPPPVARRLVSITTAIAPDSWETTAGAGTSLGAEGWYRQVSAAGDALA